MKKKVIIAIIVIISAVLLFNPFSLWLMSALFEKMENDIAASIGENQAYTAAEKYISEKYNGKYTFLPEKTDSKHSYHFSGFLINGNTYFTNDGYTIYVSITDGKIECYDNYQYDEIVEAVKEFYFIEPSLGYCDYLSVKLVRYSDNTFYERFDGNIKRFMEQCERKPSIYFNALYTGKSRDAENYKDRIRNHIKNLENEFHYVYGGIYVKNPDINTTKIINGDNYRSFFADLTEDEINNTVYVSSTMPAGNEYLALYNGIYTEWAGDYYDKNRYFSMPTSFKNIDEYTSIASNVSVEFTVTSDIENRFALRWHKHNYKPRPEETPIQLKDNIYRIEFNQTGENHTLLKLDMIHYGLTSDTVPLSVQKGGGIYEGELHYHTLGYTGNLQNERLSSSDLTEDCWYCYDDKYMYIMLNYTVDYLAFADKNI